MTSKIILIREKPVESWKRDASTWALFMALIGPGIWLDSQALQWVGAFVGIITTLKAAKRLFGDVEMTIPEARAKLDEMEAAE